MHGFLLAFYLLRTWLSKTAVTYTTEKRLCSLAGSNCSFISFILAIIAKAVSFAFMSAPNLFSPVSFRTFSDPVWSRQEINFWIIRFSFTRKSSEKLKTGSWKSLPMDLLLPTRLLWFCFHHCPALPCDAYPFLGVLFMCWVAQVCFLSSVYLKCLWILAFLPTYFQPTAFSICWYVSGVYAGPPSLLTSVTVVSGISWHTSTHHIL